MSSNVVVGAVLLALAGYFFIAAGALPFGTPRVPQSAFFPKAIATLLAILSAILLAQSLRDRNARNVPDKIAAHGWSRIGQAIVAMVLFAAALERLGFLLSTFLLTGFLLRAVEPQSWTKVITVALATALGSYAIFARALGIPLPSGIFGF